MFEGKSLDELIVAYLQRELNAEEEKVVLKMINSDPEARKKFEELSDTWRLVNINNDAGNLDVDAELEIFIECIRNNGSKVVSINKDDLGEKEGLAHSKSLKTVFRYVCAATILGFSWFGWKYFSAIKAESSIRQVAVNHSPKPMSVWVTVLNNSASIKEIKLEDGTKVLLGKSSELRYLKPFPDFERPLVLEGEAKFYVVKDKKRPLTIISDVIKTTVLGTVFKVRSYKFEKDIQVRLYEGKVMVNPKDTRYVDNKWYMTPGQELVFNKFRGKVSISRFKESDSGKRIGIKGSPELKDMLEMPQDEKGSWFMFNNQPMRDVLGVLEIMYQTKIRYKNTDIADLYFIGKFDRDDSLENILDKIVKINGLKFQKKGSEFIITQ